MIALSLEAEAQVDALIQYYGDRGRLRASINLFAALKKAGQRINAAPNAGLAAPRTYPNLNKAGRLWIIEGRYWIAYSVTSPPVISGVFYVTANIPRRISR